jgi:hypothetical protein
MEQTMKTLLAASLFAVVAAVTLEAQTTPQTTEPLRAGWTFRPSFTMGGAYDDNVLLVGPGAGAEPPSDYVTAVTPAGTLDYLGKYLHLATGYRGSLVFYQDLSDLNSLDQNAHADVRYRWTPRLTVRAGQTFASSPATDGIEFVGVPFRRIGNRRFLTTGGAELRLSPTTTLNANYDLRFVDFEDDVVLAFPGGHEHVITSTLLHQLSPRFALGGDFGLRRTLIIDQPRPITIQYAMATAQYRISENVQILGSAGLNHQGQVVSQEPRTGLAFRGEISARRQYFLVTAYYERSMLPSFGFGGVFQNEELAGTIQGSFARNRAYWQAGAAWRNADPLTLAVVLPDELSRRTTWINSRLGYRLSPWLSVEGFYTRANQHGTITRDRFGFQVVTSKPLRLAR